jgi:thymidylate synthase
MNNLDSQYQNLLQDILDNGVLKETRNGKTLSVFGRQIRHKMSEGFPLLTTKKMAIKSVMTELKWFLKGRTDIRYLNENGCKIWNGDAYKVYERTYQWELENPPYNQEEFIQKIMEDDDFNRVWGYLGPIYGSQWRGWNGTGSTGDQIANLILELKQNPDSRRLMVSAWNVNDLPYMTLPPCHYGFQVYTRELSIQERMRLGNFEFGEVVNDEMCDKQGLPRRELSLMWNQRSVDTFLGLPFNIASYGMLLHLLAKEVNMVPGELIGNLGDTHLYKDHIEQAKEQLQREAYELPTVELISSDILKGEFEYEVEGYQSHPTIKATLLN